MFFTVSEGPVCSGDPAFVVVYSSVHL